MAKITSGVFPVHAGAFEVDAGTSSESNWVTVAEMEEVSVEVENTTETWNSFSEGGWQSALVTGKAAKITLKGKRCIGDTGNDLIADKLLKSGQDAYIAARITHPNGKVLTWEKMACAVKNNGAGGKATDVGALEAELTAHGKPTETESV
jgi:hypothetical protein